MALKGRAFMAVWHDITEAGEAEYNTWHTRQHMPERLGVPGFLVGRRGVNWSLQHQRWFTLYETKTLEVLSSEDYRVRLNNPTNWSNRNQPNFLNFARSACITSASTGIGVGGAHATIRLNVEEGQITDFEAKAGKVAHYVAAMDGVVGAHLGVAAPVAFFPFSGWKDSFLGDLHAHGPDAVEFYTRKKTVTSRWFSEDVAGARLFGEH